MKKIGFFWFPIKHSTHLSRKEGLRRQPRPGVDSNVSAWSRPSVCVFIPALTPFTRRFRLGFTLLVGLQIPFVVGIRSPDGLVVVSGLCAERWSPTCSSEPSWIRRFFCPCRISFLRLARSVGPLTGGAPSTSSTPSCTSHPGVLGSIPIREEPGKTGAPCVKVPGFLRVPFSGPMARPPPSPRRPLLVSATKTPTSLAPSQDRPF